MNMSCPPQISETGCIVLLGESIRTECGKKGVCEFIDVVARLLPEEMVEPACRRLEVEMPVLPPPPPPPPKPKGMQADELMRVMKLLQGLK
ncbi:MAG TPA: hypothetical protein PLM48_09700 [Clostridia bacterium]|nr:hypothetical protein [Clostridia bacterium]